MEQNSTAKTIFSVTIITVLSRLMSLLSYQIYLSHYGANDPQINIYNYALQAPNIIFTCIGTLLTTVVVPTYSSLLAKNEKTRGEKFLNDMTSIACLFIFCLIVVCFAGVPYFLKPAFGDDPEKWSYAVFCLRTLLPVMFFYGLNFIFQGILQSHGKFRLVAAVTLPTSLVTILYVLILGDAFGVTGLVYATLIGLSLQALFLLPAVLKTGYRYKPSFDFKSVEVRRCGALAAPVLVAVSAYQINTLFNLTMALNLGQNAILGFVQNIVLVSVLAFVYSVTSVYYPMLSILWAKSSLESYKRSISQMMSLVLFLLIPATAGFILVRYPLFDVISRWGKVTAEDVIIAGNILGFYALGIVPLGFKEILDRAFYAQKNTKVSAVFGFVIMAVNVSASLLLMPIIGIYALPLSFSISSFIGVAGLILVMGRTIDGYDREVLSTCRKSVAAASAMYVFVFIEMRLLNNFLPEDSVPIRLIKLIIPSVTGLFIYFIMTLFLKMKQTNYFIQKIKQIPSKL